MRVFSYVSIGDSLNTIEVELTLWPGLPGIQIIGLPDQHLKESIVRIKSAIKSAGFDFPKAQQIVVNLRPSHFKKTSRGLELAIAAAFLWETGQVTPFYSIDDLRIYGELGLDGSVYQPQDVETVLDTSVPLLTGPSSEEKGRALNSSYFQIRTLSELANPSEVETKTAQVPDFDFIRPELLKKIYLSPSEALLLKVVAAHRLHILFAGPAGSGKSTLAKLVHFLQPKPTTDRWSAVVTTHRRLQHHIRYFPIVKPHHSLPLHSMVGGGSTPQHGEISRAHGGILLLDEFLEYRSEVLESLREPLEEKEIRVSRGKIVHVYPADFQLVATTNLCPCGDYVPSTDPTAKKSYMRCRYSHRKCHSYAERMTGPLLDRFEVVYFMNPTEIRSIPAQDLVEDVNREITNPYDTERVTAVESQGETAAFVPDLQGLQLSHRRLLALEKVAHGMRDLDGASSTSPNHWQRAIDLCITPFEKLRRWEI